MLGRHQKWLGLIAALSAMAVSCESSLKLKLGSSTPMPAKSSGPEPGPTELPEGTRLVAELSGNVWYPSFADGGAMRVAPGHDELVARNAKVEVIRISGVAPHVTLLATSKTNQEGSYHINVGEVQPDDLLSVVAYKDSISVGQTLMPVAAYASLVSADRKLNLRADINRAISVATRILIRKNVDIADLSRDQLSKLFEEVQRELDELGLSLEDTPTSALADAVLANPEFAERISTIISQDMNSQRTEDVTEAWDFTAGRQPVSEVFSELDEILAANPITVEEGKALVLGPVVLADNELRLEGSGVKQPVTKIQIGLAGRESDATAWACLNGKAPSGGLCLDSEVAVAIDGSWQAVIDTSRLVSGTTYQVTLQGETHRDAAVAEKTFEFVWDSSPPSADFTFTGIASGFTNNPSTDIRFKVPSDVAGYRITEGASCAAAAWQVRAATMVEIPWTLSAGEGAKSICLQTRDRLGNVSAEVVKVITLDQTPPTASVATVGAINPTSTAGANTLIEGSATDGVSSIQKVYVSVQENAGGCLDAGLGAFSSSCPRWIAATGKDAWSVQVADSVFTQGSTYTVTVKAVDGAGNEQSSFAVGSFVWDDGLGPAFTSIDLINDASNGYINLAERSNTTAIVGNLVSDPYVTVGYKVVGSSVSCDGNLTYGSLPQSDSSDIVADGSYKVCVALTDADSSVGYGASATFTVDTAPPTVNVGSDVQAGATTGLDATTNGATAYIWQITSGPGAVTFGTGTTEDTTVSADTEGSYVLTLLVADAAGNTASDSLNFDWDTTEPDSAVSTTGTLSATSTAGANTDIAGTASDGATGVGSVDVSIERSATGQCLNVFKTAFDAACPVWHGATGTTAWSLSLNDGLFADGNYAISSRATDQAAVVETSFGSSTITWDGSAPNPAFTLESGDPAYINSTTVNLVLSDDTDVAEFRAANGSDCSASTWNSYSGSITLNLTAGDGVKTVCLEVKDSLGNASATDTDTITLDETPPDSAVTTSGTFGPNSAGSSDTTISGTASDASSGVGSVDVSIQEGSGSCLNAAATAFDAVCPVWHAATGTTGWTFDVADALLSDATTYNVSSRATDGATNVEATFGSGSFSWDAAAPGSFNVTGPAATTADSTPAISWDAASGATDYQVLVDDTSGCASPVASTVTTSTTYTPTTLADGAYYVCVTARDDYANTTAATNNNYSFTIDTTPPGTFAITAPPASTSDTTPTVTWQAATGAATYDLAVDDTSGCSSPLQTYNDLAVLTYDLSSLATGTYYVCVTAKDTAGNQAAASNDNYSFAVTAPAAPPSIASVSPTTGLTTGGDSITVGGTNFLNGSVVQIDGVDCTSTTFVSASELTCVSPAHAAGVVDVTVVNPDTNSSTLTNGFTYAAPALTCDSGTLAGGTCLVSTSKTIADGATIIGSGNLTIQNGGSLNAPAGSAFSIDIGGTLTVQSGGSIVGNLSLLQAPNVTIDSGGVIKADGLGDQGVVAASGAGTGGGQGGAVDGGAGGGAHGGNGGNGADLTGGTAYGSIDSPVTTGSAGGGVNGFAGGHGGGHLKLVVSGTLTVSGQLTANGANGTNGTGPNRASGGGAGGSIWIQADVLAGTGFGHSIAAIGGSGGWGSFSDDGGGGAGGRIALFYRSKTFTGTVRANGGTAGGGTAFAGGAGTIYQNDSTSGLVEIIIDNNNASGAATPFDPASVAHDKLTIIGGGKVLVPDGATISVVDDFTVGSSSSIVTALPSDTYTVVAGRDLILGTSASMTTSSLTIGRDLVMQNSSQLNFNGATLTVPGDLTVNSGATLKMSGTITAANATVSGVISSDGKGEAGVAGANGAGLGGGVGNAADGGAGGGAYGGNGGAGDDWAGGTAFGSWDNPFDLGAAGGGVNGAKGGSGGGRLKLVIAGTFTLNGTISANGTNGEGQSVVPYRGAGGGSGGSIWIDTDTFAGSGFSAYLQANGGMGGNGTWSDTGGGGSGGRIAVHYNTKTYTGYIQAFGGQRGYSMSAASVNGGAGTIYLKNKASTVVDLIIDNNNTDGATTPFDPSSFAYNSLDVKGRTKLLVPDNAAIVVDNDLQLGSNSSIINANAGETYTIEVGRDLILQTSAAIKVSALTIPRNMTLQNSSTVVFTSSALTVPGDLTISWGAKLTMNGDLSAANLALDGTLDASGLGEAGGTTGNGGGLGGGVGNAADGGAGGGAYGGNGGAGDDWAGGSAFGSWETPYDLGAGGGGVNGAKGGAGGGRLKLVIAGTLTLNGTISANGMNGEGQSVVPYRGAGGGSGGSIWIDTDTFAGSGFSAYLQANGGMGGNGTWNDSGGGGSGGRIAVHYNTKTYTGYIQAFGGQRGYSMSAASVNGGAGTIYLKNKASTAVDLIIDNNNTDGARTPFDPAAFPYDTLSVTGHAIVEVPDGSVISVVGDMTLGTSSAIKTPSASGNYTINVAQDLILNSSATLKGAAFNIGRDLRLQNSASLTLDGSTLTVPGDIIIAYGATIYMSGELTATNIDVSGSINADGLGAAGGTTGAGAGIGGGAGLAVDGGAGGGAYGGNGGAGDDAVGGSAYGSIDTPTGGGSGGGGANGAKGGSGGGSLKIVASGTLTVNGNISANGTNGEGQSVVPYRGAGGGSGGSIWIDANILAGSGFSAYIRANGGMGGNGAWNDAGGGGSGGRIAVHYNTSTYTGYVEAYGGAKGYSMSAAAEYGGAGTIYWHDKVTPSVAIRMNNNNTVGARTPFDPAALTYNTLTLEQGTVLEVPNGANVASDQDLTIGNNCSIVTALPTDTYSLTAGRDLLMSTNARATTGTLSIGRNLTMSMSGAQLTFTGATLTLPGDLSIASGATLFASAAIDAANMTISGVISADGLGEVGVVDADGPGAGGGFGGVGYYAAGGGGYGGAGGSGVDFAGGATYGTDTAPTDLGSAGGGVTGFAGGNGGGALKLTATGTVTVNGRISANGMNGSATSASGQESAAGGGAGGSIWIIADTLTGGGFSVYIEANGGAGGNAGFGRGAGGGGGGRIAIDVNTNSFTGTTRTDGGTAVNGGTAGGAGSVVMLP